MQNNALWGSRLTFLIFPLQLKEVWNQIHHSKWMEELPGWRDIYGYKDDKRKLIFKQRDAYIWHCYTPHNCLVKNKIWSRTAKCKSVKVTNIFCNVPIEMPDITTIGMVCIFVKKVVVMIYFFRLCWIHQKMYEANAERQVPPDQETQPRNTAAWWWRGATHTRYGQ